MTQDHLPSVGDTRKRILEALATQRNVAPLSHALDGNSQQDIVQNPDALRALGIGEDQVSLVQKILRLPQVDEGVTGVNMSYGEFSGTSPHDQLIVGVHFREGGRGGDTKLRRPFQNIDALGYFLRQHELPIDGLREEHASIGYSLTYAGVKVFFTHDMPDAIEE